MKTKINFNIAVIGLGYVGLPLAIEFGKFFNIVGIDIDKTLINNLKNNIDKNNLIKKNDFKKSKYIKFSHNYNDISNCNIYIITLPTPVNDKNKPDLTIIKKSLKKISFFLKKNDFIIFESTFYPGTVEEILIPILEKNSKLKNNNDFQVGYSPERINPGDKKKKLENIKKIVASDNFIGKKKIKDLYKKIIKAGIYEVSNIKTAELSKLLENSQRFINIALVNQISTLCNTLNIQTKEVIDAASTKWNFMKFYPGLVGGHCVAVDPLYLSFIQKKLGLSASLIDVSKKINSGKVYEIIKKILKKNQKKQLKILILGATFKENCPDFRNSGSLDIVKELNNNKIVPYLHDPYLTDAQNNLLNNINFKRIRNLKPKNYDFIMICVAHNIYKKIGRDKIKKLSLKDDCKIIDLKSLFPKDKVNFQL